MGGPRSMGKSEKKYLRSFSEIISYQEVSKYREIKVQFLTHIRANCTSQSNEISWFTLIYKKASLIKGAASMECYG